VPSTSTNRPRNASARGTLTDGARIPAANTGKNVEVEEVLGALSLLLNGGGLPQLRTIARELNAALAGREPEIKSLLRRLNQLTSSLDANKGDIVAALDGLNRLSATLSARRQKLGTALDDLSPGLKVLEEQRGSLMTLLRQLDELSDVAVRTIEASREDFVADLRALAPVLRKLADAGDDLPRSLRVLLTYPFTDEVINAIKGDYLNVYLAVAAAPGTRIIPPVTPPTTAGPGSPGAAAERGGRDAPALPLPPADTPSIVEPPVVPGPASPSPSSGSGTAPGSTAPTAPGSPSRGGVLPDLSGGTAPSSEPEGGGR
jgi:phospholipid/cholesterol/gamma-HCH transport system substrate-binding protein